MKSGENPFAFLSRESERDLRVVLQVRETRELVLSVIRDRRERGGEAPFDFLAMYMAATDKTGERFSDEELLDELVTLIVAGYETSAGTLNWAWFLLASHGNGGTGLAGGGPADCWAMQWPSTSKRSRTCPTPSNYWRKPCGCIRRSGCSRDARLRRMQAGALRRTLSGRIFTCHRTCCIGPTNTGRIRIASIPVDSVRRAYLQKRRPSVFSVFTGAAALPRRIFLLSGDEGPSRLAHTAISYDTSRPTGAGTGSRHQSTHQKRHYSSPTPARNQLNATLRQHDAHPPGCARQTT